MKNQPPFIDTIIVCFHRTALTTAATAVLALPSLRPAQARVALVHWRRFSTSGWLTSTTYFHRKAKIAKGICPKILDIFPKNVPVYVPNNVQDLGNVCQRCFTETVIPLIIYAKPSCYSWNCMLHVKILIHYITIELSQKTPFLPWTGKGAD